MFSALMVSSNFDLKCFSTTLVDQASSSTVLSVRRKDEF